MNKKVETGSNFVTSQPKAVQYQNPDNNEEKPARTSGVIDKTLNLSRGTGDRPNTSPKNSGT